MRSRSRKAPTDSTPIETFVGSPTKRKVRRGDATDFKPFVVKFEPRNEAQRTLVKIYNECDVIFSLGCAGSGKTLASVALALQSLRDRKAEELVVVRPAVTCGEVLGHLPGDLGDKLDPFTVPIRQAFGKVAFGIPEHVIHYQSLGHIRGITYENAIVILDEAQNATFAQLKTFLTRLGTGSKFLILGDPDQSDLFGRRSDKYPCDLAYVADRLKTVPRVGVVQFMHSDVVRHELIGPILQRLGH